MKKFISIGIVALLFVVGLAGCSSATKEASVDDVISAFKDAGLDAKSPREMTKDDYGIAPMKADEAKLILLPSVCSDCGGRVFSYKNKEDLKQMKAYYDDLGKESAMLFSWTLEKDNILVQLNGDLPKEKYNEYQTALKNIGGK